MFFEDIQILNVMKSRPVGADLFHADRPTDGLTDGCTNMTKLILVLRNFASAPMKTNFRWPILIRIQLVSS